MSFAIAMKSGALEQAIHDYKFRGKWGWGVIFGRVLNGYLYENPDLLRDGDLIIPSPTFMSGVVDPHDDHTKFVVSSAADEDEQGLPFVVDDPLIVKTQATRKLKTLGAYDRAVERDVIRSCLDVPDPRRVAGRTIWVYDDVFTTGSTLDAVAESLKEAGAAEVYGLTLSRQPWA